MYLCIKRSELKPGMYVVCHGRGTFDSPFVRVDSVTPYQDKIDSLIPPDAEFVLIDGSRADVISTAAEALSETASSLQEDLAVARQLHADALDYVKQFMENVRHGTDINVGKAACLVDRFVESVLRNGTAAVTLFKLRNFDEYTYTHSINVSILAVLLGKHLGLGKSSLLKLGLAGLLHDAGKEFVPQHILNKPGKLTGDEFRVVKAHPLAGFNLLRKQRDMQVDVLQAVLEHHERHDGSGYPRGLRDDSIGLYSRVLAIVDVYDALTSKRVYKEALPPAKALALMYSMRDTQFAADDIDNFIRCVGVFPTGSLVRLTGGEHGIVMSINPGRPTKPQIKVVLNARMHPVLPRMLDLEAMEGTPEAQDIAEVLNPADYKLDLEQFLSA
ncbi:MAG: HD-GYP domain-containing protein [Proteobacteria bacterium]|nr:HD-GYP domain-containing protein [Pseudomonadota bacterium]